MSVKFVVQILGSEDFVNHEIKHDDEEAALANMERIAALPHMLEDSWVLQVIRREETTIKRIDPPKRDDYEWKA